jgi:hypothetical protein
VELYLGHEREGERTPPYHHGRNDMQDRRVLRRRIGQMPMQAEIAMASAMLARRLRRVARIAPDTPTTRVLLETVGRCRETVRQYRENRTWVFGGERHTFNHTPTS